MEADIFEAELCLEKGGKLNFSVMSPRRYPKCGFGLGLDSVGVRNIDLEGFVFRVLQDCNV